MAKVSSHMMKANVSSTMTNAAEMRTGLAVLFLALSNFLVTFDITAVVVAMPTIRAELGLSLSGFAWVMDAYSLAFVVLLTAAGAIADRYGQRNTLLFGTAIFLVGSILCGLAPTAIMLWVGRAVQGFGSAFVVCGALALLSRLFTDRSKRIKAFAFAGTVTGAAMAFGPSLGGFLTEFMGWRWVFLINIFFVVVIVAGVSINIDKDTVNDQTSAKIDYAGVASITLFLATSIWFLLHGSEIEIAGVALPSWAAIAIPITALIAFIISQVVQSEPAFRLEVFQSRNFVGMCFVPIGLSIGYWSLLVYLPLLLSDAFGLGTTWSSGLMLVVTLPMVFLPFVGGKLAQVTSERTFFGVGVCCLSMGSVLMGIGALLHNINLVVFGMLVAGSSTAVINSQISGAIVAIVPANRSGAASAIATTLRQGGFALGIALLGATLVSAESGSETPVLAAQFAPTFFVAALGSLLSAIGLFVLVRPAKQEVIEQT